MSNDDTKVDIAEKAAVLTKAALRAADQLGVCSNAFGKILGVSASQISRFKTGAAVIAPQSKAGELARLFYARTNHWRGFQAVTTGLHAAGYLPQILLWAGVQLTK